MKTICILSGGMDSTTLLYKLVKEGKEVKAISFDYGQRHKVELEMASKTCEKLGVPHTIVDLTSINKVISNSSLTGDEPVPHGHYSEENMVKTVVPNRNMIMASIAIGYAVNEGFDEVALGVHDGDHDVYPDCRPEFIDALEEVSLIANYQPIKIYAPFLGGNKITILQEGIVLGVDYSLTWTCYEGDVEKGPCGKCGSCVERTLAFVTCHRMDPLYKTADAREEAKKYAMEKEEQYQKNQRHEEPILGS